MSLYVFDLDLTLWDCGKSLWCDCTTPPYTLHPDQSIRDHYQTRIRLYPDVREILAHLEGEGILMALASRTSAPDQARSLLQLFNIDHYFAHQQIYPGDKKAHFTALQNETGLAYEEMTFFDDEMPNIESVGELGTQTIHLPNALNWEDFHER